MSLCIDDIIKNYRLFIVFISRAILTANPREVILWILDIKSEQERQIGTR